MKYALALSALGLQAAAYPFVLDEIQTAKRQVGLPSTSAAQAISKARTNCGVVPCLVFDATEQRVSTTGSHAYASPAADEIRGPCPGLNAAANHGYLSHSGVTSIEETITGLGGLYGMSVDLAGFLAAYAVLFTGDPVLQQWSIGGPPPSDPLTKGVFGGSQGISYSHNTYEGDSSIGRNDAYMNHGDAHSLNVTRFASAFAVGMNNNDRYTLDLFAQNFASKAKESEANNPYYFAAPFSTTLVSPAAYNFVINFMSNHTAEEPNGYFNGDMFKTFFGVSGTYPNFKWLRGQERIPENWYRRPSATQYNAVSVFEDLGVQFLAYPDSFRLGGNINGTNTYEGVDLSDLTGGVYTKPSDLFNLKNSQAACFYNQFIQAFLPDAASVLLADLSTLLDIFNKFVTPIVGNLDCPTLDKYDQTLFNKFPGYQYKPNGPGTNY